MNSQTRKLYQSDPLAFLLIQKLHLSPLSFSLLTILIASTVYLLTAWISGTLWIEEKQTGLLQDWQPWILVLFISPIVFGYYLWSFQSIESVLDELESSDVVETNGAEVDRKVILAYHQRWRKFVALGSATSFSIFVFYTRPGLKESSWTSSGVLPTWTVTFSTLIAVYIGSMLALNLITNVWVLDQILTRKELKINPLHPDRCGGLRSLSDYALRAAYLAAVLGIMVGFIEYQFFRSNVWREYWFVHLIIPLHMILSGACFFGPLWAAHTGMNRAKEELLHNIAQQFHKDYSQIRSNLSGDAESLTKGMDKIRELRAIYTFTDEFPVWPFDIQTFRRFLLTVPTPLIPVGISILQKVVANWLKHWGIS
jgi:hypothetical protein